MLDARSNRGRIIRRVISAITLIAFITTSIPADFAWAANRPSNLPVTDPVKELNVTTFALPASLGTIKYAWSPSVIARPEGPKQSQPRTTIIHIQDAHCNYYAQRKIAEIIEYFNREYGVNTINLEGGARDYDISIFTNIKDKAKRDKAADYFVKEGVVNGAEYFAINNPDKVTLWGIENVRLYIENLKVYRNSLKHKSEVDTDLKNLSYILSNLKRNIYSPELLEFDIKYGQYKADNLEFKAYLGYLVKKSKEKLIDIKPYINIYLLSQTLATEENIDFRKANIERDELVAKLERKLSRNSLAELVVKTVEFKTEKISQADFYQYLVNKAKSVNLGLTDFPELQKYVVYVSTYGAMDKAKIMDEVQSLENKLKTSLFTNDKDRELDVLSKNLALMKNMFNISLTRDDYKYYQANERSFEMRNFVKFIEREAPAYKIQAKLDDNIAKLDDYREDMCKFYEYSFKRDAAFLKNINLKKTSIIVTGGFHTENLTDIFKKQDIAYISIIPNFKNSDGYECPYFKILSGEKKVKIAETLQAVSTKALATIDLLNPPIRDEAIKDGFLDPSIVAGLGYGVVGESVTAPALNPNEVSGSEPSAAELPVQFKISDKNASDLLAQVLGMMPKETREEIFKNIQGFNYPSRRQSDGAGFHYTNGTIAIGACYDPLYFLQLALHELSHSISEPEPDHMSHKYCNGFVLYLMYPEQFRALAKRDERWAETYEFYKKIFKGREYTNEDAQRIHNFIEEARQKEAEELKKLPPNTNIDFWLRKVESHRPGLTQIQDLLDEAAVAKPEKGRDTGSWFPENEEWTRNAWLRETGLSIFAGGLAWVILSLIGLQDYAAYVVPAISALTFQSPHRTRAFNPTVVFLSAATFGAVFLVITNPILGVMATISLMVTHRHINLKLLSQRTAPSPHIHAYIKYIAWWLKPIIAFGLAAPAWPVLVFYGAGMWAGSATAVIFWMMHIFNGKEVFLSREILGLTIGTAVTGFAMFGLGFFSVPSLSLLAILILANFAVSRRMANRAEPTKRMGWKKGISLVLLTSIIFSSFLTYNGLRLAGKGFSLRYATQLPNPVEIRQASLITPALFQEIDKAIKIGKADRIFWERIFDDYSNERQVRDVATLETIKILYETKQLDHFFNGLRRYPGLLYRYLSEIPEEEHREFARYFATLKPGTRQQVFHHFYNRLRNDLLVLDNAGTVKYILKPFDYKKLEEQSRRMENLYASMVQILNRTVPLKEGALPNNMVAPLPTLGFTRMEAIENLYQIFNETIREYAEEGYRINIPSPENVNICEVAMLIGYYTYSPTIPNAMHYTSFSEENKAALLLQWVLNTTNPGNQSAHRVNDRELLREAMKLCSDQKNKTVDIFKVIATIGHYYKAMGRNPHLILGGITALNGEEGNQFISSRHDTMNLTWAFDPDVLNTVDENGLPIIKYRPVNSEGEIIAGDYERYNVSGTLYHSWNFILASWYSNLKSIDQIKKDIEKLQAGVVKPPDSTTFISFLSHVLDVANRTPTTDDTHYFTLVYKYARELGMDSWLMEKGTFGTTIGKYKERAKNEFAEVGIRLRQLSEDGTIGFSGTSPEIYWGVSDMPFKAIEAGISYETYYLDIKTEWERLGKPSFLEWEKNDPKRAWEAVSIFEQIKELRHAYYKIKGKNAIKIVLPFDLADIEKIARNRGLNYYNFIKYFPAFERYYYQRESQRILLAMAENPSTPGHVLESMLLLRFYSMSVARNPNTPEHVLIKLSEDPDTQIRCSVARNLSSHKCMIDIFEALSSDKNECVRARVAQNPNTPPGIINKLSNDSSEVVRFFRFLNPNTCNSYINPTLLPFPHALDTSHYGFTDSELRFLDKLDDEGIKDSFWIWTLACSLGRSYPNIDLEIMPAVVDKCDFKDMQAYLHDIKEALKESRYEGAAKLKILLGYYQDKEGKNIIKIIIGGRELPTDLEPESPARREALKDLMINAKSASPSSHTKAVADTLVAMALSAAAKPGPEGDIGAQVANTKHLDRLLRILRLLKNNHKLLEGADDRAIVEAAIAELKKPNPLTGQPLAIETSDGSGNRIVMIRKKAKRVDRMMRAIQKWVIASNEGVKAINFKDTNNVWTIVGVESELRDPDILDHEQREIKFRKMGMHWQTAHRKAAIEQFLDVAHGPHMRRDLLMHFLFDATSFRSVEKMAPEWSAGYDEEFPEIIVKDSGIRKFMRWGRFVSYLSSTLFPSLRAMSNIVFPEEDRRPHLTATLEFLRELKKEAKKKDVIIIEDWAFTDTTLLSLILWSFDKKMVEQFMNEHRKDFTIAKHPFDMDLFLNNVIKRLGLKRLSRPDLTNLDGWNRIGANHLIDMFVAECNKRQKTVELLTQRPIPENDSRLSRVLNRTEQVWNAQIGTAVGAAGAPEGAKAMAAPSAAGAQAPQAGMAPKGLSPEVPEARLVDRRDIIDQIPVTPIIIRRPANSFPGEINYEATTDISVKTRNLVEWVQKAINRWGGNNNDFSLNLLSIAMENLDGEAKQEGFEIRKDQGVFYIALDKDSVIAHFNSDYIDQLIPKALNVLKDRWAGKGFVKNHQGEVELGQAGYYYHGLSFSALMSVFREASIRKRKMDSHGGTAFLDPKKSNERSRDGKIIEAVFVDETLDVPKRWAGPDGIVLRWVKAEQDRKQTFLPPKNKESGGVGLITEEELFLRDMPIDAKREAVEKMLAILRGSMLTNYQGIIAEGLGYQNWETMAKEIGLPVTVVPAATPAPSSAAKPVGPMSGLNEDIPVGGLPASQWAERARELTQETLPKFIGDLKSDLMAFNDPETRKDILAAIQDEVLRNEVEKAIWPEETAGAKAIAKGGHLNDSDSSLIKGIGKWFTQTREACGNKSSEVKVPSHKSVLDFEGKHVTAVAESHNDLHSLDILQDIILNPNKKARFIQETRRREWVIAIEKSDSGQFKDITGQSFSLVRQIAKLLEIPILEPLVTHGDWATVRLIAREAEQSGIFDQVDLTGYLVGADANSRQISIQDSARELSASWNVPVEQLLNNYQAFIQKCHIYNNFDAMQKVILAEISRVEDRESLSLFSQELKKYPRANKVLLLGGYVHVDGLLDIIEKMSKESASAAAKPAEEEAPIKDDTAYTGGRMFDDATHRLWDIIRTNGNQLDSARYSDHMEILRKYSNTMPTVYLVSRRDMDKAGIGKEHNVVRFGNNIMIEENYYEKNLSEESINGQIVDSLLNVLVHEMTAARLDGKSPAGDLPVRAEGRLGRDYDERLAAHSGVIIDRAMAAPSAADRAEAELGIKTGDIGDRIEYFIARNNLTSIDIPAGATGNVPKEIMAIFEIAEEEGMEVVALSGGTARDFAVATREDSKRLFFPTTTDYDVIILMPQGQEEAVYNDEAYQKMRERLKSRLLAMGYPQEFVDWLNLDFVPGTWTGDSYVFENLLKTDYGNAFSISRLAVAKVNGRYRIFGRKEALDDLAHGRLKLWIEQGHTPGAEMTAKMIGKAAIYRDVAGFSIEHDDIEKMKKDMKDVKAQGDDAIAVFMRDVYRHMRLNDKYDKPEERLARTIDEFGLDVIFGKTKAELISAATSAAPAQITFTPIGDPDKAYANLAEAVQALMQSDKPYCYTEIEEPYGRDLQSLTKSLNCEMGIVYVDGMYGRWYLFKSEPRRFVYPFEEQNIKFRLHSHLKKETAAIGVLKTYTRPGDTDKGLTAKNGLVEYIITEEGLCAYGNPLSKQMFRAWAEVNNDAQLLNTRLSRLGGYFVSKDRKAITEANMAASAAAVLSPKGYHRLHGGLQTIWFGEYYGKLKGLVMRFEETRGLASVIQRIAQRMARGNSKGAIHEAAGEIFTAAQLEDLAGISEETGEKLGKVLSFGALIPKSDKTGETQEIDLLFLAKEGNLLNLEPGLYFVEAKESNGAHPDVLAGYVERHQVEGQTESANWLRGRGVNVKGIIVAVDGLTTPTPGKPVPSKIWTNVHRLSLDYSVEDKEGEAPTGTKEARSIETVARTLAHNRGEAITKYLENWKREFTEFGYRSQAPQAPFMRLKIKPEPSPGTASVESTTNDWLDIFTRHGISMDTETIKTLTAYFSGHIPQQRTKLQMELLRIKRELGISNSKDEEKLREAYSRLWGWVVNAVAVPAATPVAPAEESNEVSEWNSRYKECLDWAGKQPLDGLKDTEKDTAVETASAIITFSETAQVNDEYLRQELESFGFSSPADIINLTDEQMTQVITKYLKKHEPGMSGPAFEDIGIVITAIADLIAEWKMKDKTPLEKFDMLIKPYPELNKDSKIRKLRKALEQLAPEAKDDAAAILEMVKYVTRVCAGAMNLLKDTNVPDKPTFIFIPAMSDKLCRSPVLQSQAGAVLKSVRDELWRGFRVNNITVSFYNGCIDDGSKDDLKTKMAGNPELQQDNTIIYIDGNRYEKGTYGEISQKYITVRDITAREGATNRSGYLSVRGHIALGLGLLQLVKTPDKAYYQKVLGMIGRLSHNGYGLDMLPHVDVNKFIESVKKGDINLMLPPIKEENIDEHMREYAVAEEAAMKSL